MIYLQLLCIFVLNGLINCQDLRLGLLANTHLGKNPTGESTNGNNIQIGSIIEGRGRRQCCCSVTPNCPNVFNGDSDYFDYDDDLVGTGIINPRIQGSNIGLRIANRPPNSGLNSPQFLSCPPGRTQCCYENVISLSHLGNQCSINNQGSKIIQKEPFQQSCRTNAPFVGSTCGTRSFNHVPGLLPGQSSPEEFPWTVLILTQKNEFVGTGVIVPERFDNQVQFNTRKILTVAHKLLNYNINELKVRVLDYDASDFKFPEQRRHEEFGVAQSFIHPQFDRIRLINDIAVLKVDRPINLERQGISAACYPSCIDMFGNNFRNGTGSRCWVSGWGKDNVNGNFKVIQNKVDVPLVNNRQCESQLKRALSARSTRIASNFRLHGSEICAGGETGKDACEGDGGAPLVCQSVEGLWHVVGLVTWGVGCANKDVPGVYAKKSQFQTVVRSLSKCNWKYIPRNGWTSDNGKYSFDNNKEG
ncbi:unnamed protein product [Lepeophtheirus salmonis]|uniref:(salmon louse) hypothetical protein n=1 Tax=Lepeophtheirus salmonis TaxID=72036 RepID=A0A7R8CSL7_LEPSM|nr:unnamed protein product [Lepeophtheirus salmonis]CAF2866085.1 unnamed protein product [Lepeophtheirus salmonis]